MPTSDSTDALPSIPLNEGYRPYRGFGYGGLKFCTIPQLYLQYSTAKGGRNQYDFEAVISRIEFLAIEA